MSKEIKIICETELQHRTINALCNSFEEDSINMDKFLMWVMKNYDAGNSIMLRMLRMLSHL